MTYIQCTAMQPPFIHDSTMHGILALWWFPKVLIVRASVHSLFNQLPVSAGVHCILFSTVARCL